MTDQFRFERLGLLQALFFMAPRLRKEFRWHGLKLIEMLFSQPPRSQSVHGQGGEDD